ncbi:hypothetical protein IV203_021451 [Nitzschia inconspicua]|uniref:Uncharacterized protein n=1 Tax=Nitzschia inconspicua TaxID=303405 RepID=A0A9K3KHJ5_9STRA|nr:hypothetical protein IV203_021451 [Nitzschia inconspicua]
MDCELGDSHRRSQNPTTEALRRSVADFLRAVADKIDVHRPEDATNKARSSFNRNGAKAVFVPRVALLLIFVLPFALLQHMTVNQLTFLYVANLDRQKNEGLQQQKTNFHENETSATIRKTILLKDIANNDTSTEEPSKLTADSISFFDDDTTDTVVCWPWSYSSDEWWTHHPTWRRSHVNDTHYCYQKIQNERQAALYQAIYDVQFRHAGDCQNMFRRHMWSSGMGADFTNVDHGLYQAAQFQRPFQISDFYPWHYAAGKGEHLANKSMAACPSRDMYCFFLPLTKCPVGEVSSEKETLGDAFHFGDTPLTIHNDTYHVWEPKVYQWIFEYATRPQTWLWHKVYKYTQTRLNLTTPCMVMHVRRADVLGHVGGLARRYFSIAEYVNASQRANMIKQDEVPNIFLITDDANAIGEALTEFPTFNWMYIRRKRYKANEGGWEQQTPSQDYVFEMTTLLSILEMSQQCSAIVHGPSAFADLVIRSMEYKHGGNLTMARVDEGLEVHGSDSLESLNISKEYPQIKEQQRRRLRQRV